MNNEKSENIKKILGYGLSALLFLFGAYFFLKSFGYCSESWISRHIPDSQVEIYMQSKRPGQRTVEDLKKEWNKEYEMHKREGQRCYDEAKDRCWWLPDVSDRKRARDCWQSFIASLGGSTLTGKLVLSLLSLLSSYGLDCIEEWEYIEYKLNWAKYHFELCDHYQKMLNEV